MGEMTLNDLIEKLEDIRKKNNAGDWPVFLAIQPSWPFQHSIAEVVTGKGKNRDGNVEFDGVFIGEGGQVNYLTRSVRDGLNW